MLGINRTFKKIRTCNQFNWYDKVNIGNLEMLLDVFFEIFPMYSLNLLKLELDKLDLALLDLQDIDT